MRTFRDRVKGLARLPAARVRPSGQNFRTHGQQQRRVLRGLLAEIGIAGAVLGWVPDAAARARLSTEPFDTWLASYDGPVQLIDGHLRREELSAQELPVL